MSEYVPDHDTGAGIPGPDVGGPDVRRLDGKCQVEHRLNDADWAAFIACARETWGKGEFIHNDFYAKLSDDHPEVADRDIQNAMNSHSYLVAYQDGNGREL